MRKILLILIIGIAFFACDDTHTHEWGEWQHNATEHWKECTANDGAEYGRANHIGDPCTVCGYETPKPHESTITAFGKTATVTGDASISTSDFNTAVGNLSEPLLDMSDNPNFPEIVRNEFINMMSRTITIVIGNTVPASINGALTVGVGYLLLNDKIAIGQALAALANSGAFA
jgi:hypothetical protein